MLSENNYPPYDVWKQIYFNFTSEDQANYFGILVGEQAFVQGSQGIGLNDSSRLNLIGLARISVDTWNRFFICAGSYILSRELELELVTDKTDSNRWCADCCWAGHWSLNEEISRLIGAKLYVRSEPLSVIESNNPCANFIVRPVCIPTNRDTKMSVSALGPEKAP